MAYSYPYGNPETYIQRSPVTYLGQEPQEGQAIIHRGIDELMFGIIVGAAGGIIAQVYAHHILRKQKAVK